MIDLIAYEVAVKHRAAVRVEHGRAAMSFGRALVAYYKACERAENRPGKASTRERAQRHAALMRAHQEYQRHGVRLKFADDDVRAIVEPPRLAIEDADVA